MALLFTIALPSSVAPLKRRRVSPAASAADKVPLIVGVRSLVRPPGATVPCRMPALSLTPVIAAVVAGAVVSRTNVRAAEATPRLPAASATRAVIEYVVPAVTGRVGV